MCLTLEEIDSLVAVEAVCREGEGGVDVVGDAFEAIRDVARVPGVQGPIVEAPVLAALGARWDRGGVSKALWSPRARVLWGQPRRFGDPP